jgi:two-component system NtrC family response regulator
MNENTLLIVEDDPGLCRQYRWAFPSCDVVMAHSRPEAMEIMERKRPHVAVVDLGLPPDPDGQTEGMAVMNEILQLAPHTKVIVATGNGGKENALKAIARGALDFYEKPVDIETLRFIVEHSFRVHRLETENRLSRVGRGASPIRRLVTHADVMLRVCRDVERLALTNVPVLLLGESGTGKEALACALHELGPRSSGPFVGINCGAIPEYLLESELFGYERGAFTGAVKQTVGRIETAQNGTLFLDEIGELPLHLQVKLLRFLQERVIERVGGRRSIAVDVRIVSATNQSLEAQVQAGKFREDLFYRLNTVAVRIPPLRERPGDPILLARHFLEQFSKEVKRNFSGFTEDALDALTSSSWPGNVRELENRVRRAVIMSDQKLVSADDLELPTGRIYEFDLRAARQKMERELLQLAFARTEGSVAGAARLLQISRPTLYSLMETLGLKNSIRQAEGQKDEGL